ncbi:MAG: hypothetical protein RBQ97_06785 [Acholeplasma sp.]|nr:hypothetical protein [Acholeplasma sp.]
MEERNQEISLLDLWKKIWKNKYLVIIITFVIVVLGTIFALFYNRNNTVLKNKFVYSFINFSDDKYPDGSFFDYNDLVKEEFVTAIKENDSEFNFLDVESLIEDELFVISKEEERLTNSTEIIDWYFEISVPLKYFNNDKLLAQRFVESIHTKVLTTVREKNASLLIYNYINPINVPIRYTSVNSQTFFDQIEIIKNQYALLKDAFKAFIDGNGRVTINKYSVVNAQNDFLLWYSTYVNIASLEATVKEKGYIKNVAETKRQVTALVTNYQRRLDINKQVITELEASFTKLTANGNVTIESNSLLDEITLRITQNVEYQKQIDEFEVLLQKDADFSTPEFTESMNTILTNLNNYTVEYNEFLLKYLNDNTHYTQKREKEFELDSPFSLILIVLVSGILGGIFGVTTALIKEAYLTNKETETK